MYKFSKMSWQQNSLFKFQPARHRTDMQPKQATDHSLLLDNAPPTPIPPSQPISEIEITISSSSQHPPTLQMTSGLSTQSATKRAYSSPHSAAKRARLSFKSASERDHSSLQSASVRACSSPQRSTESFSLSLAPKHAFSSPQSSSKQACLTSKSATVSTDHSTAKKDLPTLQSFTEGASLTHALAKIPQCATEMLSSICQPEISVQQIQHSSPSLYCQQELFPCPIRVESAANSKKRKKRCFSGRKRRSVQDKRFNIDTQLTQLYPDLGPYLSEFIKMKLKDKMRYTLYQKWMAVNILVNCSISGYNLLRRMLPLPSLSTVQRLLKTLKMSPGVSKRNVQMMKLKVNPQTNADRLTFILLDEMSLRKGLAYNQRKDLIIGYEDDGETRSRKLASSALCVMAVGVKNHWKFPIGYYLSVNVMKSAEVASIITNTIKILENEEFLVLGITTDQGSNFETALKTLGSTPLNPKFTINHQSYFAFKDPLHLLKSARDFLLNGDVNVPSFSAPASWKDVETVFQLDQDKSLQRMPRVTKKHVYDLKFGAKMKVKLAAQVLSNSCSAAIDTCIAKGKIGSSAAATSTYLKKMNDIFDVLNSTPGDLVPLRKPIHSRSPSIQFLKEAVKWLQELDDLNIARRCCFIQDLIQSITVILSLRPVMDGHHLPYLSTRNLCQDELELFFRKICLLQKFSDAQTFTQNYAKITASSLIRAPLASNCETALDEQLGETLGFLAEVPEESEVIPPIIEVSVEEQKAAVVFNGATEIGGIFASVEVEDAATYISGYLAMKADVYHQQLKKTSLADCSTCSSILSVKNFSFHLCVSFEEYIQSDDSRKGLKYCSKSFVHTIICYERVFLYLFSKISHVPGFCKSVCKVIHDNCPKPRTCCSQIAMYLIKFFVRCRTLQSIRAYNRSLRTTRSKEKLDKMMHK